MTFSNNDYLYMDLALRLGLKGKGFTEPNPMVGAVVVKDDRILATGYHRVFGGEHAERMALKDVNEPGTTLYVTLEPCSHFGKTAPCTDIIIKKNVARVVIAMVDPHPLVNQKGIRKLKGAGIGVETGLLQDRAEHLNRHYLKYVLRGLPYVTINGGVSMDGKMTDRDRKSRWITGEQLRRLSHSLRGEFSAILAGSRTVSDDNPLLTIREDGWEGKKFFRVILDSRNRLDPGLCIHQDDIDFPLIFFSSDACANKEKKSDLHFFVPSGTGGLDLNAVLSRLGQLEIASVLIEGGGRVIDSFISQSLYDEMILFQSNMLLGGKDSVQLHETGSPVARPRRFSPWEVIQLEEGIIMRGYPECLPE